MSFIRPALLSDLKTFVKFSEITASGITSLPRSPTILEKKLANSERSFKEKLISPSHEIYLFCLEWENQVIGISGITSRIGMSEPFFAYHLLYEPHICSHLKIDEQIPVLHFAQARKKPTEIGPLFLEKQFRKKAFGKLLSYSRFLFMASFKERFASTVIAELRGVNHQGVPPFWSAVGKHFLHLDFSKADLLRAEYPEYIEEGFPKNPIYVDLLTENAQSVLRIPHENTVSAQKLLEKQGFKLSSYLDLLDAGPHMYAKTDDIEAVKNSQEGVVRELRSNIEGEPMAIVANTQLDFRATIAPLIKEKDGKVTIPLNLGKYLNIDIGDPIRFYYL